MRAVYLTKNISINGRWTTIGLETSVWSALDKICEHEGMEIDHLCSLIDDELNKDERRASAIRTFIINYFRTMADEPDILKSNFGCNIRMLINGPIGSEYQSL